MKRKTKRHYTELGTFLAKAREDKGFTQREVSDMLGYSSAQFISNFECGIAAPPLKKMKVLLRKYGVQKEPIKDLLVRAYQNKIESTLR